MNEIRPEAETMRRLELWGNFSLENFAEEFVQDVVWGQPQIRFSGRLASADQSVDGSIGIVEPFYRTIVNAEPAAMITVHEDYADRVRCGYSGLDEGLARFCASLSFDERFTHGVLAETDPSLCLFFWSPAGRWVVDTELTSVPEAEKQHRLFRSERGAGHFQPMVTRVVEERGGFLGRRIFMFDWENRPTEQHSLSRLSSD